MNPYQNSYSQTYTYPPIRRRNQPVRNPNQNFMKLVYVFIAVFAIFVVTAYFNEQSKYKKVKIASDKTQNPALATAKEDSASQKSEGETLGAKWSFNLFGQAPEVSPTPQPLKQDEKLIALIQKEIPTDNGEYSIVVKQLGSNEHQAYINADKVLPAASLYKLYLMAAALKKIESGDINENTVMTSSTDHLEQVLGGPEFGYEDADSSVSYTVDRALHRIAEVSDNYAAVMLAEKISWDYVRDFASEFGAPHTTIKSPISTSASDIAYFFDVLYQKKVVSPQASDKLIELLAGAQINNRIPDKLPSSLKIAHKTGELAGVRHDAGIVFLENNPSDEKSCKQYLKDGIACTCQTNKENPAQSKYQCSTKGPYLIVMMSNDVKGEDSVIDTESQISKVVFDFFNSPEK